MYRFTDHRLRFLFVYMIYFTHMEQTQQKLPSPIALIKAALQIYKKNIRTFLSLGLVVFLIGALQSYALHINSSLLLAFTVIAGIVVSYIVYLATIKAASLEQEVKLGDLFAMIQPNIFPAVWVSGLVVLVVISGFLFLIIPGIILAVYLAFAMFAVVLDGKKKTDALIYSSELVHGRWWAVLWRIIVTNIIIGTAIALVAAVLSSFGVIGDPTTAINAMRDGNRELTLTQSIINHAISNFLSLPITLSFTYALYEVLKRTKIYSFTESEQKALHKYARYLSIFALIAVIFSIFVSGILIAKLLPELVKATHSTASIFSAF
jgi:hypothetical protein